MPQITTIRVVRRRSVQPEQFGNATAEVELTGNVLEGEDHKVVARQMLADSRALVYENLGLKLPASAVKAAEEVDTPQETATVEVTAEDDKPKRRGRPPKNAATKTETKDTSDDIPGDDDKKVEPNIRANPEDRKDPNDTDDVPGEDDDKTVMNDGGEVPSEDGDADGFTAENLHQFINDSIKAGKLTVMQAKQMQKEMKVARVRDLDTPAKVNKAKTMIDSFVKANEAKK